MNALLFPALSDWASGAFQTGLLLYLITCSPKRKFSEGFIFLGFIFPGFPLKLAMLSCSVLFLFLRERFSFFFAVVPNVMAQVMHRYPCEVRSPPSAVFGCIWALAFPCKGVPWQGQCLLYIVLFWLQCVRCSDKHFSLGFKYTQIHFLFFTQDPVYPVVRAGEAPLGSCCGRASASLFMRAKVMGTN